MWLACVGNGESGRISEVQEAGLCVGSCGPV